MKRLKLGCITLMIFIWPLLWTMNQSQAEAPKQVKNVKASRNIKPKQTCINGIVYYIDKDGSKKPLNDADGYPIACEKKKGK